MKCWLAHRELRTSVPGVWAAGDCCTVRAEAQEPQWFQMRLWTQVPPMLGRRKGSTCIHSVAKIQSFFVPEGLFEIHCLVPRPPWHGRGPRKLVHNSCRPGQAGCRVKCMHVVCDLRRGYFLI